MGLMPLPRPKLLQHQGREKLPPHAQHFGQPVQEVLHRWVPRTLPSTRDSPGSPYRDLQRGHRRSGGGEGPSVPCRSSEALGPAAVTAEACCLAEGDKGVGFFLCGEAIEGEDRGAFGRRVEEILNPDIFKGARITAWGGRVGGQVEEEIGEGVGFEGAGGVKIEGTTGLGGDEVASVAGQGALESHEGGIIVTLPDRGPEGAKLVVIDALVTVDGGDIGTLSQDFVEDVEVRAHNDVADARLLLVCPINALDHGFGQESL
eukprot:CAMPEP_0113302706 /NCGR_PEP_ID=MMETSP0010_2-20120614/3419_1 /TAXON_ID=216773 ORGANISM="Corethron hystrix, Strain 308" /NCGR_SAMPLE_ID=MMETSP0010_2 /ASSEMBLY_ACC=CAM_ASM_000155 /LENGTH=260 /DNA_ID=CAMNT_0000156565 /DNA_START=435 /DNA_END=1217 /DNA_ORIENTATION=- /assembly_acc=CAM_ASM_000155